MVYGNLTSLAYQMLPWQLPVHHMVLNCDSLIPNKIQPSTAGMPNSLRNECLSDNTSPGSCSSGIFSITYAFSHTVIDSPNSHFSLCLP